MLSYVINAATQRDVVPLLEMIRELAEFEQLAQELEVTEDSLHGALFGKNPVAQALLARTQAGDAVGYAVFYRTFSTFVGRPGIFLDDLYVRPAFRRHGIGRELLTHVARLGAEMGKGRLEWITLRWNENAFRFYRGIGASIMSEWALLRMNGSEVCEFVASNMKGEMS
jgi:GNAT superfamily N-acetyltransferase